MKLNLSGGAHLKAEALQRRLRTCAECGYVADTMSEYHPHAFCVLVKAGYDPWQVVRLANEAAAA